MLKWKLCLVRLLFGSGNNKQRDCPIAVRGITSPTNNRLIPLRKGCRYQIVHHRDCARTREDGKCDYEGPCHTTVYEVHGRCTRSQCNSESKRQATPVLLGAGCKTGLGKPSPIPKKFGDNEKCWCRKGTSVTLKWSDRDHHGGLLDTECALQSSLP